jgi:hypothetical protein
MLAGKKGFVALQVYYYLTITLPSVFLFTNILHLGRSFIISSELIANWSPKALSQLRCVIHIIQSNRN